MAASKHIGKIGLAVCLVTLLVTVLFMNGRALGITPISSGGDGYFTGNDRDGHWSRTGAVTVTLTGDSARIEGGGAYVKDGSVHILCAGRYVLSGQLDDGSVIVEVGKNDKVWLLLDGASLHCQDSAALLVEQAGKVFLTLADGTENSISSGAAYRDDAVSAGVDGAVYSRDGLTVNGGGALRVTAEYQHGIVCNDDLVITGGTLEVTAPQDGIHAHDSVRFAEANLTVTAGDDGITASNDEENSFIYVESGSISIPACCEGMEAIDVTIAGGTLDIRPTDDGLNANGRGESSIIRITGGDITIVNETGRDADGLDSNGDIEISGGNLFISVNGSGTNAAIDYGSENGGTCTISGGTVIAAGGSTMAEGFDPLSEQCFIMYTTSAASAGTTVTLTNQAGEVLLSQAVPCGFSSIVLSTPQLQMGETCVISVGGSTEEVVVDNSAAGGFGMGGGMQWGRELPSNGEALQGGFGPGGGMPEGQEPSGDGEALQGGFGRGGGMPEGQGPSGDGEAFQGGFGRGGMPEGQGPSGDGEAFQGGFGRGGGMPEGQEPSGDGEAFQGGFGPGGGMPEGQEPSGDGEALQGGGGISWGSLIPVGVSVLFLLAGILIAIKIRR